MTRTLLPRAGAEPASEICAVPSVSQTLPPDPDDIAALLAETLPLVRSALDLPPPRPGLRVVAAMSGGVDSSVTAALLAHLGYEVVGVTLQLYDHGVAVNKPGACCAGQDIRDARDVAARLGIPHYVLDYESRFSDSVMSDFADSYLRGETPVPCIQCNREVKFRDLLATARDLGAVAMATGHYVQRRNGPTGPQMLRAVDPARDQSWFLFATQRAELDFLRFPLGGLPKPAVRGLAAAFGLRVSAKPDSQDICFVPSGKYAGVVEKLRPGAARAGEIVHVDGRVLGRHEGILNYTIGQRRGLNIALGDPLYVVRIDADAARVIVGPREHLLVHDFTARDVNWLGDGEFSPEIVRDRPVLVRVRSTRAPVPGWVSAESAAPARARIRLAAGEEGVAPGQAAVFYDEAEPALLLGGGFIERMAAE